MKHRSEIDGLRAVAVLPVILFHAGLDFFSGGFVGVDIFFVISGFLISTIIFEELEKKTFSISDFYERRARRILPMLFFLIFLCTPISVFIMSPGQLIDFGQSILAVVTFSSNILFWQETGYFEAAAEAKPFLHTWSLAVEEQFYIVFPVFTLLLYNRTSLRTLSAILLCTTFCSFLMSEWGWRNVSVANFYLLPTRAWELLAGVVAALLILKTEKRSSEFVSCIGFLLILFSILMFDEDTPFPSFYTLIPVIGATLVLIFCSEQTLIGKILSSKIFRIIGLISYSAYLWHQPVFAYARIILGEEISDFIMLALTVIVLLVSYITWKIIEQPFRDKQSFSGRQIWWFSAVSTLLVFGLGSFLALASHMIHGVSRDDVQRAATVATSYGDYNWDLRRQYQNTELQRSDNTLIFVGDSNMGDFMNAFSYINDLDSSNVLYVDPINVCSNGSIFENLYSKNRCRLDNVENELLLNYLESADAIFIAVDWRDQQITPISHIVSTLRKEYNLEIYLIGSKWTNFNRTDFEYLYLSDKYADEITVKPLKKTIEINKRLSKIEDVYFIDPLDWLCVKDRCQIKYKDQEILQYDGFHLTPNGAEDWSKYIISSSSDFSF